MFLKYLSAYHCSKSWCFKFTKMYNSVSKLVNLLESCPPLIWMSFFFSFFIKGSYICNFFHLLQWYSNPNTGYFFILILCRYIIVFNFYCRLWNLPRKIIFLSQDEFWHAKICLDFYTANFYRIFRIFLFLNHFFS